MEQGRRRVDGQRGQRIGPARARCFCSTWTRFSPALEEASPGCRRGYVALCCMEESAGHNLANHRCIFHHDLHPLSHCPPHLKQRGEKDGFLLYLDAISKYLSVNIDICMSEPKGITVSS